MTTSSPEITTTTYDLTVLLGSALPFAGTEYDDPGIAVVQIHAGGGVITAIATNRYAVGYARKKASGELDHPIAISRRDGRRLRRTLSRAMKDHRRGEEALVTLTYDPKVSTLTVDFADVTMRLEAIKQDKFASETFGKVRSVMAELVAADTAVAEPVALGRLVLGPVMKAARWADGGTNVPLRWCFGGRMKPARVEIEDWFVAAVMPVRVSDAERRHVQVDFPSAPPNVEPTMAAEEMTSDE